MINQKSQLLKVLLNFYLQANTTEAFIVNYTGLEIFQPLNWGLNEKYKMAGFWPFSTYGYP